MINRKYNIYISTLNRVRHEHQKIVGHRVSSSVYIELIQVCDVLEMSFVISIELVQMNHEPPITQSIGH